MTSLRESNLVRLGEGTFDVLVVGGGVNGAVASAALSARGARVALVDRGDFACGTSQESSNLAWGGIKYLEGYEFALVSKLCKARNELLRSYPSAVRETRFFAAHPAGFRRPLWMLSAGTWFYWLVGRLFTQRPRRLSPARMRRDEPLVSTDGCDGGVEYSDACFAENDARFVWGFVRDALDHGCVAANYVSALGAVRGPDGVWTARVRDEVGGPERDVRSRVVVNACGPWADAFNAKLGIGTRHRHVLSKGIHLLVPRITDSGRVLAFFADDGRLFWAIPMGTRTCIGTTDTPVEAPEVGVTDADRRFVIENVNKRLKLERPLAESDIVAERCGVRPLVVENGGAGDRDWMQLSRKHAIEVDPAHGFVTIFGGKLTDCLNVGEELCRELPALGVTPPWPRRRWYGEPPEQTRDEFMHRARLMNLDAQATGESEEPLATRLWRRYGGRAFEIIEEIRADASAAQPLVEGADLVRAELGYLRRHEMIVRLDDLLRRRTRLSQLVRREELAQSQGLREACRALFGDEADARWRECFGADSTARTGSSI